VWFNYILRQSGADITRLLTGNAVNDKDQGTISLTIKAVASAPGWESRLHTHTVDVFMGV
jgi:hypothetical protein